MRDGRFAVNLPAAYQIGKRRQADDARTPHKDYEQSPLGMTGSSNREKSHEGVRIRRRPAVPVVGALDGARRRPPRDLVPHR